MCHLSCRVVLCCRFTAPEIRFTGVGTGDYCGFSVGVLLSCGYDEDGAASENPNETSRTNVAVGIFSFVFGSLRNDRNMTEGCV